MKLWTDELVPSAPIDIHRRIFCNRSLDMSNIKAVGFDMDYTLAQYTAESFEGMAHRETVRRLVVVYKYPEELYNLPFDWRHMTRGLVVDKHRGNMLKLDRHKYVKVAQHGFRRLTREERHAAYEKGPHKEEPDYAMLDTLFSIASAYLFMQLVEMKDTDGDKLPAKSYYQLYKDVWTAIDDIHRDGTLKTAVASNPAKYIQEDPYLGHVLTTLRANGRKVFLATNSLWDYTHVVMNFLLGGRVGKAKNFEWLEYFDVVVVGCSKPKFFTTGQLLFAISPSTGALWNTEEGAPIVPVDEEDMAAPLAGSSAEVLAQHKAGEDARVFQGGSVVDLHKMLGITSGNEVLYVGDHIYGDILKSKKTEGWRTMLVVPELEVEQRNPEEDQRTEDKLEQLRMQQEELDDRIQRLQRYMREQAALPPAGVEPATSGSTTAREQGCPADPAQLVEDLIQQRAAIKAQHAELLRSYHEKIHPVWGRLLKTGYQKSRYGHQVERFACLYTSQVSNLALYSVDTRFRAKRERMAHER